LAARRDLYGVGRRQRQICISVSYSTRHDFDGIRHGIKYILDGMVASGKLPNDNPKYIVGFGGDYFTKVDKGDEKVIVEISEE